MDDLQKLPHVVEHWMEHNEEHARTYRQWAGRAREAGKGALAAVLDEIASETERMQALFARAKEEAK